MRSLIYAGFTLIFACLTAERLVSQTKTPVVREIRFIGNKTIRTSALLRPMQTRKNQPLIESVFKDDLLRILQLYKEKNYFLASVDSVVRQYSSDSSQIDLTVFLTEHYFLTIDSLLFTGNRVFSADQLMNRMETLPGSFFDPSRFKDDMDNLLKMYENNGYPFAGLYLRRITIGVQSPSPSMTMELAIEEGPCVSIHHIQFNGIKQTRPDVIYRTLRIPVPTFYRHSEIENSLYRLRRLPFIESVAMPELVRNRDSLFGLLYTITEGPANIFDGIAGYVPQSSGSNDRGYFTGMLNLSFRNLFGTARRLDAFWQKKDRYSQEFALAYTEPWILNLPSEASISLRQLVQDTTYILREYAISFRLPLWIKTDGLAAIRRKMIDPANPATSFIMNIPYASSWSFDFGFVWDSRDNPINTRSGSYYKATLQYTIQKNRFYTESPNGTDTLWIGEVPRTVTLSLQNVYPKKVGMDVEWYLPVTGRWVVFSGLHGWLYQTSRPVIPASELFRLGGLKTVRGYFQDQFSGSRVVWNNLEARWLTTRDSRIFLFLDWAYYERNDYADAQKTLIRKTRDFLTGYGFGLRFQTRIGLFGLDYGLGKNDNLNEGKIHFGLTSPF